MVFSSIIFLFGFLPLVLILYYILNAKIRNAFLLIASLFFYYWGEPKFVLVMILSIVWNYLSALILDRLTVYCPEKRVLKKVILFISILGSLSLLYYFKYFDFSVKLLNQAFHLELAVKNIVLPIGISFFTFQGLSYVVDVYREDVKAQRNIIKLGMYIALFPQLIAGPIVRYVDIAKEIDHRAVTLDDFYEGIKRFTFGLSKKVILSNPLAYQVDLIFAQNPANLEMSTAWLGAILYALQIYFDFSGYSDMAIGLGRMFGFTFLENFNLPYIATSIQDFWRRWHISLSSWFRDYVYIPLGGNRRGNVYCNLMIVFFLTGLWHGASLNFVVWGLWHGCFQLIERILRERNSVLLRDRLPVYGMVLRRLYTGMVVLIGWVFFRADNLHNALEYLKVMFGLSRADAVFFHTMYYLDNFTLFVLITAIIFSTDLPQMLQNQARKTALGKHLDPALTSVAIIMLLMVSAVIVMASSYNPFIYFRF